MATQKSKTPKASDNGTGTDTDVAELEPQKLNVVNLEKSGSIWAMGEDDKARVDPEKREVTPVPKAEKDDEQALVDSLDPKSKDPKEPEKKESGEEPVSVLAAMTQGDENEFTLDDPEKKAGEVEGAVKDGEPEKQKEKINDADVVSRIAKEFEISEVQTPEQLISAIREKLSIANAGANAPVAGLDKVLALNNRDLYKAFLMRQHNFSDERAEKYITQNIDVNGEEWIDIQAGPVRLQVESLRERTIKEHVSREVALEQQSAKFATTARNTVKEIKTLFGKIPLAKHVGKLKEFQAKISTDEGLEAMRNDPKRMAEAMFVLEFGGQIIENFLEEKLSEEGIKTWGKFYKSEIADKILRHSKTREQTEYSNKGIKPGNFEKGSWD